MTSLSFSNNRVSKIQVTSTTLLASQTLCITYSSSSSKSLHPSLCHFLVPTTNLPRRKHVSLALTSLSHSNNHVSRTQATSSMPTGRPFTCMRSVVLRNPSGYDFNSYTWKSRGRCATTITRIHHNFFISSMNAQQLHKSMYSGVWGYAFMVTDRFAVYFCDPFIFVSFVIDCECWFM